MLKPLRLALLTAGLIALIPIGTTGALAGPPAAGKAQEIRTPDPALTLVHGWHCGRQYAPRWGWHRHAGACRSNNRRNRSRRHYRSNSRYDDLYEPYRPGVPPHRKALTDAYRKQGRDGF